MLPLKSIARLEKRRFTVVQLRVYADGQSEPYDLSVVSRQTLLNDIVTQAAEMGHKIDYNWASVLRTIKETF